MPELKKLQMLAKDFSVLYAEDNEVLKANVLQLLRKFFHNVYSATQGKEALELFEKYHPQIVITDIKMLHIDAMELSRHIIQTAPETKIIFMSAHDEKETLLDAIEVGVFRFLKKPVHISELAQVLNLAMMKLNEENQQKLYYTHLENIFNYQTSMIVMLKGKIPVLANKMFLDFFGVQSIEDFLTIHNELGNLFLEHEEFLYSKEDKDWFDLLSQSEQSIYHVKMRDKKHSPRHFIVGYKNIPQENVYKIMSFNDVTELYLLKHCAQDAIDSQEAQEGDLIINLLEGIKKDKAKVHLHNYYKGLSITNDAQILQVEDGHIILKTNFLQEKAIQYEKKTLIISEVLPRAILCSEMTQLSFEKQTVGFKELRFIKDSPMMRKTIRVVPENEHRVTLFIKENKFRGKVRIEDISLDAVKLKLNAYPAGLRNNDEVIIDMVLTLDKTPLIINTKAVMLRKSENAHNFSVVFMFKFDGNKKSEMMRYITTRQMNIIREFKGLCHEG
ncbi:response regulator [bacterium]|nr:response regulator [bacterium]MBU1994892.1 response regulator [bacterium]